MSKFCLTRGFLAGILAGAAVLALPDGRAVAQSTTDYAVQVTAAAQNAPPKITLSWPAFAGATQHTVSRKAWGATSWDVPVSVGASATGYVDNGVTVGTKYEYQVLRSANVTGYGYVATGIE